MGTMCWSRGARPWPAVAGALPESAAEDVRPGEGGRRRRGRRPVPGGPGISHRNRQSGAGPSPPPPCALTGGRAAGASVLPWARGGGGCGAPTSRRCANNHLYNTTWQPWQPSFHGKHNKNMVPRDSSKKANDVKSLNPQKKKGAVGHLVLICFLQLFARALQESYEGEGGGKPHNVEVLQGKNAKFAVQAIGRGPFCRGEIMQPLLLLNEWDLGPMQKKLASKPVQETRLPIGMQ